MSDVVRQRLYELVGEDVLREQTLERQLKAEAHGELTGQRRRGVYQEDLIVGEGALQKRRQRVLPPRPGARLAREEPLRVEARLLGAGLHVFVVQAHERNETRRGHVLREGAEECPEGVVGDGRRFARIDHLQDELARLDAETAMVAALNRA